MRFVILVSLSGFLVGLGGSAVGLPANNPEAFWETDLDAAGARAARDEKPLLIVFR